MKNYKAGFTLSELLIALAVAGVLVAVLLPIVFNLMPNQNIVMARRAYNVAQATVYDMINDERCYPDLTNADPPKEGFDDGAGHANCTSWPESSTENTLKKFTTIFKSKVDYKSDTTEGFMTKDGLGWTIKKGTTNDEDILITVNVRGNSEAESDQFTISVAKNGRMTIEDNWARNAVKIDNDFIGPVDNTDSGE